VLVGGWCGGLFNRVIRVSRLYVEAYLSLTKHA